MKKIFVAATIVGASAAWLILYLRKKNNPESKIEDSAEHAHNVMNRHIANIERITNRLLS